MRPADGTAARRESRFGREVQDAGRAGATGHWPKIDRALLWSAHLVVGLVVLGFAISGLDYYLAPLAERPRHPLFWDLKPGGTLGLRFGYAGATMMTLLLLYSVRKRVPALRRLGSLRRWLHWHIFLGIWGPLLIVLHSSLKVGGLVSISFWSMVAVASSGVLGRFLYQQIPRSEGGEELSVERLVAEDEKLAEQLASRWGLGAGRVTEVLRVAERGTGGRRRLLALLLRLPFDSLLLRVRLALVARKWTDLPQTDRKRVSRAALHLARAHRRLRILEETRRLFRAWHVVHKPFALILYTLMIVHIGVAWMTGYGRLGP